MTAPLLARRASLEASAPGPMAQRVAAINWTDVAAQLDSGGCATTGPLLPEEECTALAGM
jgi:hypothetical protein